MQPIIEKYRQVIVQIAAPQSTGTGFFLKDEGLIVTNNHVVEGNREIVIEGAAFKKQLARVLYIDPRFDLAFVAQPTDFGPEMPEIRIGKSKTLAEGDKIVAVGHPFGLKYTATQGIVSNTRHSQNDINYIQHDAALNPGNSGGPLVDEAGEVVGINTFIIRDGNNIGFSLPADLLAKAIVDFKNLGASSAARCASCLNLVSEKNIDGKYCPHCGSKIELPDKAELFQPSGVPKTVETILEKAEQNVPLSRKGPFSWEIKHGSAKIDLTYHEKSGLLTADAFLAQLPKENIAPIYEYLLRQNWSLQNLSFSVHEQDIVLSLLIFDRYLNEETGLEMLRYLFEKADEHDNVLVEKLGALWKPEE